MFNTSDFINDEATKDDDLSAQAKGLHMYCDESKRARTTRNAPYELYPSIGCKRIRYRHGMSRTITAADPNNEEGPTEA